MAQFSVTIDNTKVSASQTDFPALVDLSDLPLAFWDAVSASGGDIRVYEDDGVTELAREVVSCDNATDTGELWVKVANLSAIADTEIIIDVDGLRDDYAVDAPNVGRNAVWAAYDRVYHLGESSGDFVDSTGSGHNGTVVGSVTRGVSVGALKGVNFGASGHTNYINATAVGQYEGAYTLQLWGDFGATQNNWAGIVQNGGSTGNSGLGFQRNSGTNALRLYNGTSDRRYEFTSGFSDSLGAVKQIVGTSDASETGRLYLDKAVRTASGDSPSTTDGSPTLKIGNERAGNAGIGGAIAEYRQRTGAISADWITTEYNNQSSPSTFYAVTEVAGGTTGTLYSVFYPSAQADPTAADIKAGTVANGFHSSIASPEVSTLDFEGTTITGLTAGVSYRHAVVWDDGVDTSLVAVSDAFVTSVVIDASGVVSASAAVGMSAEVTSAANMAVSANHATTAQGQAAAQGQMATAAQAGTTMQAMADFVVSITAAASHGQSMTGQVDAVAVIDASMIVSAQAGVEQSGQVQAHSDIQVSAQAATDLIAQAATQAGIAVGSIHNVTITGGSISGDVVTPAGRTHQIALELRTLNVQAEDRTYTVH